MPVHPYEILIYIIHPFSSDWHNFLIDQLGRILRETPNRMDHLPGRISEEMIRKLAEEEPQDLAIDATERAIERPNDPERQKRFTVKKKAIR